MHQVRELQYFLLGEVEGLSRHLPDGGIEANVQTFQLAVRQSNDSLDLLPESVSVLFQNTLD